MILLSEGNDGVSLMLAPFNNSIAVLMAAGSRLSEAILISLMMPFSSSMLRSMSTLPQSNVSLFLVLNSFHLPKRYSLLPICWLKFKTSSVSNESNAMTLALPS